MKKRTWVWAMLPNEYDIACDICGNADIAWSEYEGHVWCPVCQKDTRGTDGLMRGPVPVELVQMMGISLDRIDVATGEKLALVIKSDGTLAWEGNIESTDER